MVTKVTVAWGTVAKQALLAGMAAGAIIECYLWFTTMLPAHASILASWQWIASTAVGPVALANPSFAWLGLALHFIVSIGWAGGYAYLAQLQPSLNARWPISGVVYGLVVLVFMNVLLVGAHAFTFPDSPNAFLNELVAHGVFFGLPLAYVVAAMDHKH